MQRITRVGRTHYSKVRRLDAGQRKVAGKFIDDQIDFVWTTYQSLLKNGSTRLTKKEHSHYLFQLAGSLYSIKLFECITDRLTEKLKGKVKVTRNRK